MYEEFIGPFMRQLSAVIFPADVDLNIPQWNSYNWNQKHVSDVNKKTCGVWPKVSSVFEGFKFEIAKC